MSYYRDVYLKSEDWKNLRAAKLHSVGNRCFACGHTSPSNDVHHIQYRKPHDVKTDDLIVLCRPCHDFVHKVLSATPKGHHKLHQWRLARSRIYGDKKFGPKISRERSKEKSRFSGVVKSLINSMKCSARKSVSSKRSKLNPVLQRLKNIQVKISRKKKVEKNRKPPTQRGIPPEKQRDFFVSQRKLVKRGLVLRDRMILTIAVKRIGSGLTEDQYLAEYIRTTSIDPRSMMLDVRR